MDTLNQLEEYAMALARERAAWSAVRGSLPGSLSFDHERWQHWRGAVDEADLAAIKAKTAAKIVQQAKPASRSRLFARSWPAAVRLLPLLRGRRVG